VKYLMLISLLVFLGCVDMHCIDNPNSPSCMTEEEKAEASDMAHESGDECIDGLDNDNDCWVDCEDKECKYIASKCEYLYRNTLTLEKESTPIEIATPYNPPGPSCIFSKSTYDVIQYDSNNVKVVNSDYFCEVDSLAHPSDYKFDGSEVVTCILDTTETREPYVVPNSYKCGNQTGTRDIFQCGRFINMGYY